MKAWSLATCLGGWLLLACSLILGRWVHTDNWQVVIPLTLHLFSYMTLASGAVLSLLWTIQLSRWDEDMGVACINLALSSAPVLLFLWRFWNQEEAMSKYVFGLMWTGQ